ncbi:glycosyltransferase family 1 protein [candidate division KSB1 bacterium]|nr:MAG: glycosyltransferase family 1 protein [candidate division KSB1 bacterium]MBC6946592.1 glycosyltransferase family 1 protein [candidate division KSB1 bacterium]MCE7940187.1 glycosyltransferase family 1 protein [Chlorobi bacterium CHB1]MDL1873856.1 glycosyltransferase family 4 protein [Cytophagia bacterium CHB2]
MHICLATREFPPITNGGIASYYVHLAQLLADHGHEVTVLTVGKEGKESLWTYPGVRVIRLSHPSEKLFRRLRRRFEVGMDSAARSIADGLAMRDWLFANATKMDIDVVETVEFDGAAPFLIENELPPTLVMCHGSNGQVKFHTQKGETPRQKLINSLEVMSIGLADEVGCYSPLNAEDWERFIGRKPRFITAPYKFADPRILKKSYDTNNTGIVVGRMNNWKGIFELVEALNLCVQRGNNVKIRWIGSDQAAPLESVKSVKAYLQERYPSLWGKHFLWEEFLPPEETRRAQLEADFAIVPSRWDTFNFTAIEALSLGTPLIISTGAGASYLCKNMENGIVVPSRDARALANAIEILQDGVLRERLGKQGRATIQREFAAEKIVAEHVAAYESAMERHRYRKEKIYNSSLMEPFVRQWQQSINIASLKRLAHLPRKLLS